MFCPPGISPLARLRTHRYLLAADPVPEVAAYRHQNWKISDKSIPTLPNFTSPKERLRMKITSPLASAGRRGPPLGPTESSNIGGWWLATRPERCGEIKSSFFGYPQRIAVTRLLYLIQAPDAYKSSTSDSPPLPLIMIRAQDFSRFRVGPSTPNATHSDERLCLSQQNEVTATVCLAWVLA